MVIPNEKYNVEEFLKKNWCVYFLFDCGNLIYIGKTGSLENRLRNHLIEKRFDSFSFISVSSEEDALYLENCMIEKYDPVLNIHTAHWVKIRRKDSELVEKLKKENSKDLKCVGESFYIRKGFKTSMQK